MAVFDGERVPDKWVSLLHDYAQAYQETGIAGKRWYEEHHNDGKYESVKRYISKSKAQAYLRHVSQTAKNRTLEDEKSAKNRNRKSEQSPVKAAPASELDKDKDLQCVEKKTDALCAKQSKSKRGGKRPGTGGPVGNTNAKTHGVYSKFLLPDDQAVFDEVVGKNQMLESELAVARVRLTRALAVDSNLRTIDELLIQKAQENASDDEIKAILNHAPLQLEEYEFFDSGEGSGEKWVKKRPDMDSVIDRCIARIANLESAIYNMSNGLPLKRHEQAALQGVIYRQLKAGEISPVEAGRQLEEHGLPLPQGLSLEIRTELANPVVDDEGGITEEELDRIVAEGQAHQQQQQEFKKERQEWIDNRFSGGDDA